MTPFLRPANTRYGLSVSTRKALPYLALGVGILAFIGAAVIPQLGGYLSVGYAQGHLPASVVSPTMIGQPVMTALLAIPLLGETLHGYQVLGGLVVLAGIYMVHRSRSQQKDAEKTGDISQ